MKNKNSAYKERINLAIHRQQRKRVLSKEESKLITERDCPFCEYFGECDLILDESSKGHTRQLCKIRSNELDTFWIEISDDRPYVEIGAKYGKLTVLSSDGNDKHANPVWKCQCECGTTKSVLGFNLLNGRTSTCGSRLKHKNDKISNTGMATSTANIEDKIKRKYIRGSSINPDGSKHIVRYGYHSKVGTSVSYVIFSAHIKPIELNCPVKNEFVETSQVGIDPGGMVPLWWCEACYADARLKGVPSNAWHDVVDGSIIEQIVEIVYPHLVKKFYV